MPYSAAPLASGQLGSVQAAKLAIQEMNDAGELNVGGQKRKMALIIEDSEDRQKKLLAV